MEKSLNERFEKNLDWKEIFHIFFDNINFAAAVVNEKAEYLVVNKYATELYGYSAEEFEGKTIEFVAAKESIDFEFVKEKVKKAFEGHPQQFVFWGKKRNGEVFEKIIRMTAVNFGGQKAIFAREQVLKISDALGIDVYHDELRYENILNNINDAILIIKNGIIIYANRAAEDISGYSLDEILFKRYDNFILDEYKERLKKYFQERLNNASKLPEQYEIRFITKQGNEKYLRVKPKVINWGNSKAILEIITDVTKVIRQQIEKGRLHKIIENSNSFLYEWTEANKGYVTFVTNNIVDIIGYEKEELIERKYSFFDIIYSDDLEKYKDEINRVKKIGLSKLNLFYRIKHKSGKILHIADNITIEIDSLTYRKTIYGVITDISENYELKAKIAEQEKHFSAVIENIKDTFVVTRDGVILFANKYTSVLLKTPLDEIVGSNMQRFIHPEDYELVMIRHMRRMQGDKNLPLNYDFRLIDAEGNTVWVNISPTVVDWEGKPAVFGFLRDITKEKLAQEELIRKEYRYRTIIENMTEALTIIDEYFKLRFFNQAFSNILEAENNIELLDNDILRFIHPDDVHLILKMFKEKLNNNSTEEYITVRTRSLKGNQKWVSVKSVVVNWENTRSLLCIITDITQQKLAESKSIENEQILETLINSTEDDIICFKDGEGRWLKANQADLKLFQLEGVDYVGKTNAELAPYSPYYKDAFLKCMETDEQCWQNGVTTRGDEVITMPTGEIKIYDVIKTPIFNEDGTRKGLIVFGRDVTRQREMEKLLRENEKKYRTLFENLHESVVVTQNGLIKFFNPNFVEISGYSEEELLDKTVVELIHPDDRPSVIDSTEFGFSMHISDEPYEFRLARKDKKEVWMFNRAIKIDWENSYAIMNFMRDISKEKQALEELNKLSVAVEQSAQGFIILDSDIKIEYVNPYLLDLFEMEKEEILNQNLKIITPKDSDEETFNTLVSALFSEKTWSGEVRLAKKNGQLFWGYVIITPIKNTKGKLTNFLIIIINIDEIKKIQTELIEAKEKAESSDKLKSYFLAQMSHEIRTPINALLSFAGLIKAEIEDKLDDELKFAFTSMENAGRRIIRTIDLLLNMSEVQVGSYEFVPKKLDIDKIVNSVLLEYKVLARDKGLYLNYHLETDKVIVEDKDEYSVSQIIANIVDNAVKYTHNGGIDITLGRNENNELFVEVKDTGIGISKEFLDNIFEPFTQEDQGYTRKYEGNGLGLALISEFARINNAEILVQSKKGEGSTFTLVFRNDKKIIN